MVVEVGSATEEPATSPNSNPSAPQASKLPDHVLEAVFAFLELPDLQNCSLVCKNW